MSKPFNRSINAERQSQFLWCPLWAISGHSSRFDLSRWSDKRSVY